MPPKLLKRHFVSCLRGQVILLYHITSYRTAASRWSRRRKQWYACCPAGGRASTSVLMLSHALGAASTAASQGSCRGACFPFSPALVGN